MDDSNQIQELSLTETRLFETIRRDLGPLLLPLLEDPKTIEIMVNPDNSVWLERMGGGIARIGTIEPWRAESLIRILAGYHDKYVTPESPLLEVEIPLDGSRFSAVTPPAVASHAFTIRKKASAVFTLDEYVSGDILTEKQAGILKQAVTNHKNILVIGGTGSGKTTLVNALIHEITVQNPAERICIIEDTGEIQCSAEDKLIYHTCAGADMTDLLRNALRMRPDRILVGEVRGKEALDLLDAWNTGHEGGVATLHANNAYSALARLKSLVSRNLAAPRDIEPLIADAVHFVVHIMRTPRGRRIKEILEIRGFKQGEYQLQPV